MPSVASIPASNVSPTDSLSNLPPLGDVAFVAAREELIRGGPTAQPAEELWAETQRVGGVLLRQGAGFPPSQYASGGVWDTASIEDAVSGWTTDRLVDRGQLRKIVLQASNTAALRRLLEGSLRQHLIDQQAASQSKNLFRRVKKTVEDDERFECTHEAKRASERRYRLAGTTHVFAGDERTLCGMAWAAGDFPPIVYRDDAQKLSPVLEGPDLADFLAGLLGGAGEMTVRDVITAMSGRYGLAPSTFDAEAVLSGDFAQPEVEFVRDELADGVIARLTERQLQVLKGHHEEQSVREMAEQLDCSVGTISSETKAIRGALDPLGGHASAVLNEVLDRAFKDNK